MYTRSHKINTISEKAGIKGEKDLQASKVCSRSVQSTSCASVRRTETRPMPVLINNTRSAGDQTNQLYTYSNQ